MRNKNSTNPNLPRLHLTPQQTWWAEHSWDATTLEVLLEAMNRPGLTHVLLEEQIWDSIEHNARVNMDGMIPSGEWVVELLQNLGDRSRNSKGLHSSVVPSKFPLWQKYPELSQPVRLYAYIKEEVPSSVPAASRLLLLCSTLTDVDVDFLLGGVEGCPTGRRSREEVIAHLAKNPAPVRNIYEKELLRKSPSVYNGFLPREHLYLLMSNHSFADSPRFDEVLHEIERWRDEPALNGVSFGEELFLFLQAVLNPATNHASLALIQSLTRREEKWVQVLNAETYDFTNQSRNLRQAAISAAALKVSARLEKTHDSYGDKHLKDVGTSLVTILVQHPNWVPTGADFKPVDGNNYRALVDPLTAGYREDAERQGDDNTRFNYFRKKQGDDPTFWRDARKLYPLSDGVRARAQEVILEPKSYGLSELCSYAHMIGGVLHPIHEVRKELSEAGSEVPTEWLLEIIR